MIAIELEKVPKFVYADESQKLGKFTNISKISLSAFSVNLDFAFRPGDSETAHIVASVVMNPQDAKAFLIQFEESMEQYEKKFGKLKTPEKKQQKKKKSWFKIK